MKYGIIKTVGDVRPKTLGGVVRYVGPNCTYTTINDALDAASDGDTVLVAPGTYNEAIVIHDDHITLKSIGSPQNTIITQATGWTIDIVSHHATLIDGFTINLTSPTATTDANVHHNNADANSPSIFQNCIFNWNSSVVVQGGIIFWNVDGGPIFSNCQFNQSSTYTGTSANLQFSYYSSVAGYTCYFYDCHFVLTNTGTDSAQGNQVLSIGNTHACNFYGGSITSTCAVQTGGINSAFTIISTAGVNVYNTNIRCVNTSTGKTQPFAVSNGTNNMYGGSIYSHNTDNDGLFAFQGGAGSFNAYGVASLGDTAADEGTINRYGVAKAGDAGYKAISSKTTGGSGSAGSGKQYVEIRVGGTTYKALYET